MPAHVVEPWAFVQAMPQAEQVDTVPSVVSQPAAIVQSAKPALQPVGVHVQDDVLEDRRQDGLRGAPGDALRDVVVVQ